MLSFSASLLALIIVIAEKHVHIVLSRPATYSSLLHHRCGLLLLGCLAWLAAELLQFFAPVHNPLADGGSVGESA
jgi:hypothetical protein